MVKDKGGIGKIKIGIRFFGIQRGRQLFMIDGHGGLEQAGCARPCFEVTDVAFGRAQGDALTGGAAENGRESLDLGHIADFCAGAVGLDQGSRGRIQARVFPCPQQGEDLTFGIGRGDALALAVAGRAHAADDRVNPVAVPLGIAQALEEE